MCLKSERVDESSGARSFTLHPPPAVNGRSMMTSSCCHIRGDEIWRLKNGTTILTESASANSQLLTIKQEFHWKRQRAKSARETERFNKLFYSRTVFLVVYLKSNNFILKAKYHNEASGFVFFIEKRRKVKGEKHNITPNIWRDNNRTKITSREAGGSAEVWKTKLRRILLFTVRYIERKQNETCPDGESDDAWDTLRTWVRHFYFQHVKKKDNIFVVSFVLWGWM